jgi:hypothetical protein
MRVLENFAVVTVLDDSSPAAQHLVEGLEGRLTIAAWLEWPTLVHTAPVDRQADIRPDSQPYENPSPQYVKSTALGDDAWFDVGDAHGHGGKRAASTTRVR